MPDRYADDRYKSNLLNCRKLTLVFDGKTLTMHGDRKKGMRRYPAASGKPIKNTFDYSLERQKKRNLGPIPAGTYWIRPDELWENAWYKRGSTISWGNFRIIIHPFPGTRTWGRGGFFIHGGTYPGSAGCIDLTRYMQSFVADLTEEIDGDDECQIHLEVKYPPPKIQPTTPKSDLSPHVQ